MSYNSETVASNVECALANDGDELSIMCTAKVFNVCIGDHELVEVYTARPFVRKGGPDKNLWKVGKSKATDRNTALLQLLDKADQFCGKYDVSSR